MSIELNNCIVMIIIIVFVFLLSNNYETFGNYIINSEFLNPICDMNCCYKTWTTDNEINIINNKYLPSNTMCDNGNNTGCMCTPILSNTIVT